MGNFLCLPVFNIFPACAFFQHIKRLYKKPGLCSKGRINRDFRASRFLETHTSSTHFQVPPPLIENPWNGSHKWYPPPQAFLGGLVLLPFPQTPAQPKTTFLSHAKPITLNFQNSGKLTFTTEQAAGSFWRERLGGRIKQYGGDE